VKRKVRHLAHRTRAVLPAPINHRIVREQHLRHVTVNMGHLTDPAYLGAAPPDVVRWISPSSEGEPGYVVRPPVPPGLGLASFSAQDAEHVHRWLAQNVFDSDAQLDARMDNHNDEVGRTRAALRTRLRIANPPTEPVIADGPRVAFDARALQSPAFGNRGIGRFAKAALVGARRAVGDDQLTLIVDRGLRELPAELAGSCRQVTRIEGDEICEHGTFIQPSPMTHSPDPILGLLQSTAYSLAVVFDFIPWHFPTIYLNNPAARSEYAANLDALRLYTDFTCISRTVRTELTDFLRAGGRTDEPGSFTVAWPTDVLDRERIQATTSRSEPDGPIVLMTGDEPRKNTFGGLAGIAAATCDALDRETYVVGMAGQGIRVHHWSIAAAMRPGEAIITERISDDELSELLATSSCVVVPSFDEGLSLPVIEAVMAGTPVVTSDITAHAELVGTGAFTCDPRSPRSITRAIERTRGRSRLHREQARKLAGHKHMDLEDVVASAIESNREARQPRQTSALTNAPTEQVKASERLRIGVATPWSPQRTGVADFSTATFSALAEQVDLTVYTTGDAIIHDPAIEQRSVDELFADPTLASERHDVFVSVVGNSHFHLPFVQLLSNIDAVVIAHDTRMVEFYMSLRAKGGAEQVMLCTADALAPTTISPALDDQIDDMRILQNAGFWEIAKRSVRLITHSPSAAPRLTQETGRPIEVLPFANQRVPSTPAVTSNQRLQARERLGLDPQKIHLASFGYVDPRTKMTEVVVETVAWLVQWGHPVALHLVGHAKPEQEAELSQRAERAGIDDFQITGFQSEEDFRDWLLAVDAGIQLRISPLLGVSGPLSDLAAFGTPAVASSGLCIDVDTPEYIHRLPDSVSPVMVAEAIEQLLANPMPETDREAARCRYLEGKTPERYAHLLLEQMQEVPR
jgi:glycosyltransferase involved in cell wall biosynthesis